MLKYFFLPVKIETLDYTKKEHSLLVVERDINLNNYLKKELGSSYDIAIVGTAKLAIQRVQLNPPSLIIIDFDLPENEGVSLAKYFKSIEAKKHIPIMAFSKNNLIEAKIEAVDLGVEAYFEKPFSIKLLKSTIRQILASRKILLEKYSLGLTNVSIKTEETDRNFMQSVLVYVQGKLNAQDLNVEIMASHFLLSRSQFYRKIKTQTGFSPNEFIRKVRLEKAKSLLVSNDLNVNEVIYEVGFSSSSYFAKCFKKEFGYLPMQIKKK